MSLKIEIKELNFWYGANHVLKGIQLGVECNKILALIGPSGCGKSTLLRALNRIGETAAGARMEGEILLGGAKTMEMDVAELRKRMGMVFQRPNPFPKSIFDNVAFGPRVNGLSGDLKELVEGSLHQAGLWEEVKDKLQESALSLSGGQQQRLCIARALAVKPEVLLLDEPCSALDPESTAKIEELLCKLKQECTMVMVTHNIQQAKRVSDRTAFLLAGELIEEGETEKLFAAQEREETQRYLSGQFG